MTETPDLCSIVSELFAPFVQWQAMSPAERLQHAGLFADVQGILLTAGHWGFSTSCARRGAAWTLTLTLPGNRIVTARGTSFLDALGVLHRQTLCKLGGRSDRIDDVVIVGEEAA